MCKSMVEGRNNRGLDFSRLHLFWTPPYFFRDSLLKLLLFLTPRCPDYAQSALHIYGLYPGGLDTSSVDFFWITPFQYSTFPRLRLSWILDYSYCVDSTFFLDTAFSILHLSGLRLCLILHYSYSVDSTFSGYRLFSTPPFLDSTFPGMRLSWTPPVQDSSFLVSVYS